MDSTGCLKDTSGFGFIKNVKFVWLSRIKIPSHIWDSMHKWVKNFRKIVIFWVAPTDYGAVGMNVLNGDTCRLPSTVDRCLAHLIK